MEDKVICNIELVEIVTEETSPKTFMFDTADEATYSPDISEGKENILRVKNRIVSTNKTEDIQYGSSLTFKDTAFQPEVLAIVDGGTVTKTENKVTGYSAPAVGGVVNRIPCTINIYTSEKDTSGEVLQYAKFSYPSCKGKPAKFSFKDGEYMTPEYTMVSRPAKGAKPFDLTFVKALPTITKSVRGEE
ncbi:MAG: hypothetical protein RSF37_14635 [Clostridium sp.]|uniref:hypothetical protein n=1 Tax=Clostridium sp. TaxID=1506 RepID=UPI002FCC61C4